MKIASRSSPRSLNMILKARFEHTLISNQFNLLLHGSRARLLHQEKKEPQNEKIIDYQAEANRDKRLDLESKISELRSQLQDVPIVIDGREYRTDKIKFQEIPFDHQKKLAQFYHATPELIQKAIRSASERRIEWESIAMERKLDIFEKAADLVSGKFRSRLNAATILGQAKTIRQAEVDSAAELVDFLRFNAHYTRQLLNFGIPSSSEFEKNSLRFRSLDGFVAAISPFNFTAIGGNLASAPIVMGNCVVWKPSDTAVLANYVTFQLLREAGVPDGVINFVPSDGLDFGRVITRNPLLAGINFTGSLSTFQWLYNEVGLNIREYRSFPRLVGECGGKNFHLVHKTAHIDTAIAQTIRSAFEYSGQKCSACSRFYVPESIWKCGMKDKIVEIARKLKVGPANESDVYTSALIDSNAYRRVNHYVRHALARPHNYELLCGGKGTDEVGHFMEPTIFITKNPQSRLMQEEIFGPVLSIYVYPDTELEKTMDLINTSQFALTGSVFAQDENFIESALSRLKVGNFYINDKSTGAVVGQQPFGGWLHSGTNDKAGGPHYLMRWCNQQTVKRTLRNLTNY